MIKRQPELEDHHKHCQLFCPWQVNKANEPYAQDQPIPVRKAEPSELFH